MIPVEPASFTKEFERTKEGALVNRNIGGEKVYRQQLAKLEAEKNRDEKITKDIEQLKAGLGELKSIKDDLDFIKSAIGQLLKVEE